MTQIITGIKATYYTIQSTRNYTHILMSSRETLLTLLPCSAALACRARSLLFIASLTFSLAWLSVICLTISLRSRADGRLPSFTPRRSREQNIIQLPVKRKGEGQHNNILVQNQPIKRQDFITTQMKVVMNK